MFWPKKVNFETVRSNLVFFTQNYPGLGGYLVFKSGLGFSFWGPEVPFLVPPNCKYCAKYAILRVPEMALPVPETKIRDHF